MLVKSQALSELFYTTDTYGTFNSELLDEAWYEESEFDSEGFMKDLAELHAEVINDALPAGGIKSVRVVGTSSPQFYNYSTDQVELEIDVDLFQLYRYLQMYNNAAEFEKFIKEHFTSRDGFWSYTPNTLKDFYETMDGTSAEYDKEVDRDKCITVLAGWYLTRECLTEEEYLDKMYDRVHEIMYNNFTQFSTETWREYTRYEDDFNRKEEDQTCLFPRSKQYPLEIDEWYKKYKEVQNV